jgi:predicted MFS family arabinose efflux permease
MDPAPRRHGGATVALLAGMLVIHNAHRMGVTPLFGELRDRFGTDYAGVGTLFSAYVLGYAICQTLIGFFGDRFDARRLLLTGLALSILWSALFALARSYQLALLTRFLLGATSSLLYTPAMSLGILLFDRAARGKVMGTIQSGAGIGMGGAVILMPLIATRFGITASFLSLSLAAALLLALTARGLPAARRDRTARPADSPNLARRLDFWNLLSANFTGMLASYGLLTWLPTYLAQDYGFSTVSAGTATALFNVAMLVAAPLVGMLADLPGGRVGVLLVGSTLTIICYVALLPQQPLHIVLLISVVIGVSLSATTAPMMLFGGERFDPRDTQRVVGLFSSAAQVGAALAGGIFGAILARTGSFTPIWAVCAALAIARLALLLTLTVSDRAITARRRADLAQQNR